MNQRMLVAVAQRFRMSVARHLTLVPLVAVMAIAGLVTVATPHPARGAATIVVNTTADEDINNGTCSLREAINAANLNKDYHGCAASGAGVNDKIVFNLGAGTPTINIGATPLPAISEWVTIDGGPGRVVLHGPGAPPVSGSNGLFVGNGGFGTIIRNLVINNFSDDGILIDADEVSVLGCFIGTDANGAIAVPNQGFGVQVFGGNGVRIGGATSGGPCSGDCNVISGATNSKANVLLDLLATGALVRGNFIGTDVTGTAKIMTNSLQEGIVDKGGSDRIGGANGTTPGGACTGDCNLISGNGLFGDVVIDPAATGSMILGNFIGTDVTGTQSINEGTDELSTAGIFSQGAGTTIGGTTPAARNVVSGTLSGGIQVRGLPATVQGNYIGTNSAGTAAVPHSGPGVTVFKVNGAIIGGTAAGAGNLISGATTNGGSGIQIGQSTNTQIVDNRIGTAADGTTALPNNADGVLIHDQSSNNTVGGTVAGSGNIIAFNGLEGVRVDGGTPQVHRNAIRRNSIHSNGDSGIALFDNGNDSLARPTIEGINPLHGTSCAPCTVEIFSDLGNEGRVFEGSVSTTDGNWTFSGPLSGPQVTATNTDMTNNTSEFSLAVSLTMPTASVTASPSELIVTLTPTNTSIPTSTNPPSPTRTPTNTPTVSATKTPTNTSTSTLTATSTRTETLTRTATETATASPSQSQTPTHTPSATRTSTPTPTPSMTTAPTNTATGTPTTTSTRTETPTRTATVTATASPSRSQTLTSTPSPTRTPPSTSTASAATAATNTATSTSTTTSTRTETPTRTATGATTLTATATETVTRTVGVSPTATSTPTPVLCVGDCSGTSSVAVDDIIVLVNITLETAPASACPHGVPSDAAVDVALIIQAVNNALNGCAGS